MLRTYLLYSYFLYYQLYLFKNEKPNKPFKTPGSLAIANREPTPIKPPFVAAGLSIVEIDPKSDFSIAYMLA